MMETRDVMTSNPYSLSPNDTILHAAQEMKQHHVGCMPICDQDHLVGVITDRDVVTECVAADVQPQAVFVRHYMTASPVSVSPETGLDDALAVMAREQIRRLCVTEGDRLVGMVSLGDLAVRMPNDPKMATLLSQISEPVRSVRGT